MKITNAFRIFSLVVLIVSAVKGDMQLLIIGLLLFLAALINNLYDEIRGVKDVFLRYRLQARDAYSHDAKWHDVAASNSRETLERAAQDMRVQAEGKEVFRVVDLEDKES